MTGTMHRTGPYTEREELAHSVAHGLGIAACLAVIPWLIVAACERGAAWRLVGGLAFGLSALLLFTASTLYHAATEPQVKRRLRVLDHCAIYLLIAGTYTPFTLGVLRGALGWTMFGVVWGAALAGIVAKLTVGTGFKKLSTLLYVAMGWSGLIAIRPLLGGLTRSEGWWLLAGGVCYTAGVPFYLWKRRRYTHTVWHVFVLAGVCCHFVAIIELIAASGDATLHP